MAKSAMETNIRADWEARVSGANEVKLQVKIILNSYSIYVNSLPNAVNIGLNGQYVSLDSPALSYDSNTSQLTAELASQSFTVQLPAGSSRDLDLQGPFQAKPMTAACSIHASRKAQSRYLPSCLFFIAITSE